MSFSSPSSASRPRPEWRDPKEFHGSAEAPQSVKDLHAAFIKYHIKQGTVDSWEFEKEFQQSYSYYGYQRHGLEWMCKNREPTLRRTLGGLPSNYRWSIKEEGDDIRTRIRHAVPEDRPVDPFLVSDINKEAAAALSERKGASGYRYSTFLDTVWSDDFGNHATILELTELAPKKELTELAPKKELVESAPKKQQQSQLSVKAARERLARFLARMR